MAITSPCGGGGYIYANILMTALAAQLTWVTHTYEKAKELLTHTVKIWLNPSISNTCTQLIRFSNCQGL